MNKKYIKTDVDVTNTKNSLKYLKDYYRDSRIEFLGWVSGRKVILIDEQKYYLSSVLKQILLKETRVNNIQILETKRDKYIEYNEILKEG